MSAETQVIILQIDEGFLSAPSAVEFPTEGGLTAFMNYYPPKNKVGPSNCYGLTSTSFAFMLQQDAVALCTGNYYACPQKHPIMIHIMPAHQLCP